MTALLFLHQHEVVFESGMGSGFQTALLVKMSKHVYTVERDENRLRTAEASIKQLGITNITYVHGDAALGLPQYTPFDRMIFGAAFSDQADKILTNQLADSDLCCWLRLGVLIEGK